MSDTEQKKMIDLNVAEQFCQDLKFRVDIPNITESQKFVFLPSTNNSDFDAKFNCLDLVHEKELYLPTNLHVKMASIYDLHQTAKATQTKSDIDKKILDFAEDVLNVNRTPKKRQ